MNDLVNNISELSPERRILLELLLKEQGVDVSHTLILPQSHDRDRFPLSYAQQRLWFLEQFQPGTAVYNIPTAVRMSGKLDAPTFQRSIDALVQRHGTLRTRFGSDAGQPLQVIAVSLEVPVQIIDLSHLPESEQESEALCLAREEALRPFDLETGPLFSVMLIRLSQEEHIALLTMHHIISDGWSMGVLIAELAALYEAFLAGKPSPLPELSIQYVDYALWQQRWLNDGRREEQLSYWGTKLDGAGSLLTLPTDRPRPAVQTNRGATFEFELSPELSTAIKDLSRRAGATYFVILLAIFDVLLYRYAGQDDISIGTPVANRSRAEIEGLIGFFVNTLVLRTDLSGDPSFRELLGRVREVALEAQAHQDLPFEMLVDALQLERDMSYSPLFQVMFALQNAPSRALHLPDLTLEQIPVHSETSKFDLTLIVNEGQTQFRGILEYDVDLFSEATIARMVEHFLMLAEGIVADPDRSISAIPLLTDQEAHQILVEWNQTGTDDAIDSCIHTMVQDQVARTPDATALVFGDQMFRYQQLNAHANQLAHYLSGLGVGRGTLIGVSMQRSADMVVGLLAILKVGAAYVPVDPTYPEDRKAFIIEDAQVRFILTQTVLRDSVPAQAATLIFLDQVWPVVLEQPAENPDDAVTPDDLAYVLFTSGSTGRPKGVAISHHSAVALAAWARRIYSPDELAGMLASTSINFDLSVFELFATLACGGTVILAENALELPDLAAAQRVTLINTVPSAITALLRSDSIPESVRTINLAGEPLSARLVDQLYEKPCIERVYDLYGPTEDTTYSTWTLRHPQGPETIGRPLYNTQLYILDTWLQPVPVGVPGEVYLGGAGLARGYLHRPGLTAERFVPNPFLNPNGGIQNIQHASQRLYRTGDLARYLSDGNIEFLGRVDHQVKIRGFRIELGEIENALNLHPALREVIVLARTDTPGDKRLVAYVVPRAKVTVNPTDLRGFLLEKLPEYMVPGVFIVLEALPLTPNGKVNRQALPAPDLNVLQVQRNYVAPRTPSEEILVGIWKELLTIERIGVEDSFFELGGHSLLATQVIARIRVAFEIEMPVRSLFEAPTVSGLAKKVEQMLAVGAGVAAPSIAPIPRDGELPLSFGQQRLWFLDKLDSNSPQYNIPDAVRIKGSLQIEALEHSLNEIVRRHEILRTTIPTVDGVGVQLIAPQIRIQLPVVGLSHLPEQERLSRAQESVAEDARRPFDLAAGPLLRASLLRLDKDDHVFLLTMHHIVSDGWSTGIFIRELVASYRAYVLGEPSPLPELANQYADYAAWQRNWLQGEVLEAQLDYWKQQLGDVSPVLDLPTDRPRPEVHSSRGAHHFFTLPVELSDRLRVFSREEGATLFMTLLAAFQSLLHRYARQDGINVGTPIANRNRSEIEGLIGFFVNTLVLHADFSENPTFTQLLAQVRERALGAYAHQDIPFELLVDALHLQRDMSRTPLFQVMFALQNIPTETVDFGDLQLEPLRPASGTAMFDITLTISDRDKQLGGVLEYNTDLFDESTMQRLLAHYQILLSALVADPDQRVDEIPLLTEQERQQMLVAWNSNDMPFAGDETVPALFQQQVGQQPGALAVVYGDESLSFAELDWRSNQLAHHLRSLGVGLDQVVGLMTDRSLQMMVGILGIMKAGAAYLPLDPTYPHERIAYMIEDSGASVLVTQENIPIQSSIFSLQSSICIDADWPKIASQPTTPLEFTLEPEHLAYVIYTSGSTGKPKGVMISHRSALNLAAGLNDRIYRHLPDRKLRISLNAPLPFDASVQQWVMGLVYGHTLDIIPDEVRRDGEALLAHMRSQRLDLLDCVPTQLKLLLASGLLKGDSWRPLAMLPGGEAIDEVTWRQLQACDIEFFNMYGPTECTVDSTICRVNGGPQQPSIGRPIGNSRAYVLDANMRLQPIGVSGELYLGGAGVGRGYLHRPGLTAERFVPDLFSGEPGARLYRTGDLVRYLPDGNLDFQGRIDYQVKVRGFRIELGEIEAVLRQVEAIADAVVIVREDRPGVKRIVAYLVNDTGEAKVSELRSYLEQRLPEYMIPSAFVSLPALPLTPNNKIDRKALPAPDQDRPDLVADYVSPVTDHEVTLVEVWQHVLGLDRIGINDNFFELGGDSILSIQVIARANSAGLRLTPQQLFQYPTIAGLASVAIAAPPIEAEQGIVIGPVPLTPIQRWFFEQDFAESHHWNQTIFLEVAEPLDPAILEAVVADLQAHHDALRLRFAKNDDGWEQKNAGVDGPPSFEVIDLLQTPASDQTAAITTHAEAVQASLDLTDGPLLRVVYYNLGPDRSHRLLIVVHHLAIDGISWRVLLEDLQAAYLHRINGQVISLPPKTTSFQGWAEHLADYAKSERMQSELDYWLGVANMPVPSLPLDITQAANTEITEASTGAGLTAEETKALLQDVPPVYRTEINDVLLAALSQVLSRWTGSNTLLIGLEGHGREDIFENVDISRTVGWFTTLYPLVLDISQATGPGELIRAVKEQLRDVPQHGLGYGLICYMGGDAAIKAQLQAASQPEIIFNYLGQFDQALPEGSAFSSAPESSGRAHAASARRSHLIEINGGIMGGCLRMEWTFSTAQYRSQIIERLASEYMQELRDLIRHCQSPVAGGVTPSDFTMTNLSQRKLDKLVTKIRRK